MYNELAAASTQTSLNDAVKLGWLALDIPWTHPARGNCPSESSQLCQITRWHTRHPHSRTRPDPRDPRPGVRLIQHGQPGIDLR
jgi:hypothetical protein